MGVGKHQLRLDNWMPTIGRLEENFYLLAGNPPLGEAYALEHFGSHADRRLTTGINSLAWRNGQA